MAQEGNIYFTELAERVEYGNHVQLQLSYMSLQFIITTVIISL